MRAGEPFGAPEGVRLKRYSRSEIDIPNGRLATLCIAMIMQPHDGWLMRGTIEVCIPPAVTSLGSARFFAFALSFHELQLFLIDLLLWSTGIHCCLNIVTSKHGLVILFMAWCEGISLSELQDVHWMFIGCSLEITFVK